MDGFIMSVRRGRSLCYRLSKKIMPGVFQVYLLNKSNGVHNKWQKCWEVLIWSHFHSISCIAPVRLLEAVPWFMRRRQAACRGLCGIFIEGYMCTAMQFQEAWKTRDLLGVTISEFGDLTRTLMTCLVHQNSYHMTHMARSCYYLILSWQAKGCVKMSTKPCPA